MLMRALVPLVAILLIACPESTTIEEDGGIMFDASLDSNVPDSDTPDGDTPDGDTPDSDVPDVPPTPSCGDGNTDEGEGCDDGNNTSGDGCSAECTVEMDCGNGRLEAGESCDDGNTEDGDGCNSMCRREAFCGDGEVGGDEVCDDGNNRSGDGCRSDCTSDETCGNGIRDAHVGELCDGTPGCAANCLGIAMCGNGDLDEGETCDDGNNVGFDGCGPDCQTERSMVISSLQIGGTTVGCDFSGDGVVDNQFSNTLGPLVGIVNSMFLGDSIGTDIIALMHPLGLDDPTGFTDPDFSIAWLQGKMRTATRAITSAAAGSSPFRPQRLTMLVTPSPRSRARSRAACSKVARKMC